MSETFQQFKEEISAVAFADGLPENLVRAFEQSVKAALIRIETWCAYYRRRNRDVHHYCSSYFACGATVVPAPRGRIQRVYTLEANCCPVFYDFVDDYDTFLNWLNSHRQRWTEPDNTGMPSLPAPFKFMESSLDKEARFNYGKWCQHNQRIYVGQRIESTETIVLEWEGVKRDWADGDLMPYDDPEAGDSKDKGTELKEAVVSYVRAEHLRRYERDERGFALERTIFDNLLADMIHEDRVEQKPKIQPEREFDQHAVNETCGDAECAAVESTLSGYFAILGDWGKLTNGTHSADVQSLIQGWNPDYIVTVGDNRYSITFEDLLAELTYYAGVIDNGMMFPGVGNHDTDDGGGISEFLETFDYLPDGGRNYDFQLGDVHFLFRETHDGGSNIPTAEDLAASAARLRVRLAASKAPWKVVITQDPPYVSDTNNGNGHVASQLDYEGWGADLVVSGDSHFYERLERSGFPYIVNGAGGAVGATPTAAIEGSVIRQAGYGAMRGHATCDELVLEFFDTSGTLVDTLTLTK